MAKTTFQTPVFFIATKVKKQPAIVNFFTQKGKPVAFRGVKKVKTKEGVRFYAKAGTSR